MGATRAASLLERLEGMHEAFAFPLIGALIAVPQLVVIYRPQPAYARRFSKPPGLERSSRPTRTPPPRGICVTPRALAAMLCARLYVSRRHVLYACADAVLVGSYNRRAHRAAPLLLSVRRRDRARAEPGRYPHLDRCEQSAPLFGRELARARRSSRA